MPPPSRKSVTHTRKRINGKAEKGSTFAGPNERLMKKVFAVDVALVPAFVSSAATGIGMHIAGHISCHEVWHTWAVCHVVTSVVFLGLTVAHIVLHKAWYRSLFCRGLGHKSPVTIVLLAVFLLLVGTGVALLFVEGANSGIGLSHWGIGLLTTALSVGHISKR